LQYCTPNNKVKIPTNFNYPDTGWSKTEPPCILISGEDKYNLNKILYKKDIKFVQRFKILTIYNLRYKMAGLFRKIKAIFL